jgi:hypothetical protein
VTKVIELPTHLKLVRISKRHRDRRAEYTHIGQAAVRRFRQDFDLTSVKEARSILVEMINTPNVPQENNRAAWVCEGAPVNPFASTDPADQIIADTQILKLLAHVASDTLSIHLIQGLPDDPHVTVSRQFMKALRLIIQHHPNRDLRRTYLDEIDHILEAK